MISVTDLTHSFSGDVLFNEISFTVKPGDRIGLVGRNGAGKSTLFKIITGKIQPESGTINIQKNIKLGYLTQDISLVDNCTLVEETRKAYKEKAEIEEELNAVLHQIETRADYESQEYADLIDRLTLLQERFHLMESEFSEARLEQVLLGLGFRRAEFGKHTSEFSGGWRMRIELAKLLLAQNDVLLLDEPTNHLDIRSIIWMEHFLKSYTGAVMIIAHDKMLLDKLTNKTYEVVATRLYDYKAPYSQFLNLRAERIEKQVREKANQDQLIKDTEKLIDKFRYKKNKAAFAQTLIRKLDKLEAIEVDDQDLSTIKFSFPDAEHSGKVVLSIRNLKVAYGTHTVLNSVTLDISRGEQILLLGGNGQGKSTLIKAIMNQVPYEGEIEEGYRVIRSYYAQEQTEALEKGRTVLDIIESEAPEQVRPRVRSILGSFLFSGDDVYKTVNVLSGGERARLALCKMFLHPSNLLILDEPTNHLDINSKEVLKKALQQYGGSYIVVSHDRSFLENLGNKIYEVQDGALSERLGSVQDFFNSIRVDEPQAPEPHHSTRAHEHNNEVKGGEHADRKQKRQLERRLEKIESRIETLQKEMHEIPMSQFEKLQELDIKINALNAEYEEIFEKLSRLE
jgi:ATP-binding cassette subfamily F protein 3